ncbi:MAG: phage tail protein [Chloroflexi bacterium]|nr:phage tail protein [Chloroflexota bacterium]
MSLVEGPAYLGTSRVPSTLGANALQKIAATAASSIAQAMLGIRFDPAPAYLFSVEVEGIMIGLFTGCDGLEVTRDVYEYREGGLSSYTHKLPGQVRYENLVLRRGLGLSRALWEWFNEGLYDYNVQRTNFSIIQGAPGHNFASALASAVGAGASAGGNAAQSIVYQALGGGFGKVKHWNVEDAYPVRWKGPSLNTSSKTVAIEEIEIAHHGLTLTSEVGTPMSVASSLMGAGLSAASAIIG